MAGEGILLAAESEHAEDTNGLKHDFEKLFYVRSPLKLFMCRTSSKSVADVIKSNLEVYMRETCSKFSPAEVFILYFVWSADEQGTNKDIAYLLQMKGDSHYCEVTTEKFEQIPVEN